MAGYKLENWKERINPLFKPCFNILLHIQSIVCATVTGQCLEYLRCITLVWHDKEHRVVLFNKRSGSPGAKYELDLAGFALPYLIYSLSKLQRRFMSSALSHPVVCVLYQWPYIWVYVRAVWLISIFSFMKTYPSSSFIMSLILKRIITTTGENRSHA